MSTIFPGAGISPAELDRGDCGCVPRQPRYGRAMRVCPVNGCQMLDYACQALSCMTVGRMTDAQTGQGTARHAPDCHWRDSKGRLCPGDRGPARCRTAAPARRIDCPAGRGSPTSVSAWEIRSSFSILSADALPDEFLGICLAQGFELRELGVLYYVQASSETLGDALRRAARYSAITLMKGCASSIASATSMSIAFEYVGVARLADRHQIEFFVTTLVRICRHLTGHHLLPSGVKLMHRRIEMPSEFRALFGCDVAIRQRCR